MKKDLFIIESPFQLLCAIEAVAHFAPEQSLLVIKYSHEAKNNEQIDKLVNLVKWTRIVRVRTFYFVSLSEFLLIPYLAFLKLKGARFNRIFIGEPRSMPMLAFLTNLRHQASFFLDDGNLTFFIQEVIRDGKDLMGFVIMNEKFRKIRSTYYKLFGIRERFNIVPNWYTCFDIQAIQGQEVHKNKFDYLRNSYLGRTGTMDNRAYFIGGNISESGILSIEDELRLLEQIVDFYREKGIDLVYCVHRRESNDKLSRIKAAFANVTLRYADYPLELDLIYAKVRIANIASFYSTALITVKRIFQPEDARMFLIPTAVINEKFRDELQSTYQNYLLYVEGVKLV